MDRPSVWLSVESTWNPERARTRSRRGRIVSRVQMCRMERSLFVGFPLVVSFAIVFARESKSRTAAFARRFAMSRRASRAALGWRGLQLFYRWTVFPCGWEDY